MLHLRIPILLAVDRTWDTRVVWEMALAVPILAAVTLFVLPFAKGAVIGFAWSHGVVRNPAAASEGDRDT